MTSPQDIEGDKAPNGAKSSKFRVAGTVARAMARFGAALNPTYSFGEHKTEEVQKEAQLMRVMSAKALSGQGGQSRSNSGRTSSGRPVHAGVQHGHKGNVLFKPLPEPEAHQEVQHQQQHSSEGPLAQLAAALNPTYTFGEHKTEEVQKEAHLMHVMSAKVLSGQGGQSRSNSGRTSSGRPVHAGVQHGHKGNMLFKPLSSSPTHPSPLEKCSTLSQ